MIAKAEAGLRTLDLPPRSPDLNVLDYSLWHAINVRMRKQEAAFDKSKKESPAEYLAHLRRVALGLPTADVMKAVGDMKRRCAAIAAAKGYVINE